MPPPASLPLTVGSRHQNRRRQHEYEGDEGSVKPSHQYSCSSDRLFLGDRLRRKEIRGTPSVFSFSSIIGQSSSVLTPTCNSVGNQWKPQQQPFGFPSREFGQKIKDNHLFEKAYEAETFAVSRQKIDWEHGWKRCLAQPVRRLTSSEDDSVARLQRSRTGFLT